MSDTWARVLLTVLVGAVFIMMLALWIHVAMWDRAGRARRLPADDGPAGAPALPAGDGPAPAEPAVIEEARRIAREAAE